MRLAERLFRTSPPGPGFPVPDAPDPERYAADLLLPAAEHGYVIHFTARSGSSWLTDIAARSRRLGRPDEMFNPGHLPRQAAALNAASLDDYCKILPHRGNLGGVWGFEITWHQLRAVFGPDEEFIARFGQLPWFWLIRRDIVAQGISLAKMQATKVAHAPSAPGSLEERDSLFAYDAAGIRRWIRHLRSAETGSEALFRKAGITPFRLSYEQNTAYPANHVLKVIAREIGLPRMRLPPERLESAHHKIATAQNEDYAARFREEEAGWLATLEAERAPMLALEQPYPPRHRR